MSVGGGWGDGMIVGRMLGVMDGDSEDYIFRRDVYGGSIVERSCGNRLVVFRSVVAYMRCVRSSMFPAVTSQNGNSFENKGQRPDSHRKLVFERRGSLSGVHEV